MFGNIKKDFNDKAMYVLPSWQQQNLKKHQ